MGWQLFGSSLVSLPPAKVAFMSAPEHYWLFRPGVPAEVGDAEPARKDVFTSLVDARLAALRLGGNLDIFATPATGGGWRFVEHFAGVDER